MSTVFKDQVLAGKVAFVTGGGSGINQRIAERLAEAGAKVALLGRTLEKLEATAASIRAKGGEAACYPADVRQFDAVKAAFDKAHEDFGDIDIVVAGAAGNFPAPAVALSSNGFKSVVDIDLLGTFHTYKAAFDHLRKPGASLVSISAPQAYLPMPMQAHVCAAKAGVDMLTKTLAYEWGPMGIRANCVTPGPIEGTEGMDRLAPAGPMRDKLVETLPLRRLGQRDEIADMVVFLSSDASSFVTGSVLLVDGGQSLGGSGGFTAAMGL